MTCSISTSGARDGHPRFREVGRAAGLEPHGLDHGLGAVVHGRQRRRPPRPLRGQRPRPEPALSQPPGNEWPGLPAGRGGQGARGRRPERGDGDRGRRLLGRRARRPVRDELPRPAARRLPQPRGQAVRRRPAGLRRRARPDIHRLGRHVGRPRQRRQPRARDGERRDPDHEPREGRRAGARPDDRRWRRQAARRRRDRAPERARASRRRTSTTTETSTSRSARSAGRCSCSGTRRPEGGPLARGVAPALRPGRARHGRPPGRPPTRPGGARRLELPLLGGPAAPLRPWQGDARGRGRRPLPGRPRDPAPRRRGRRDRQRG